MEYYEKTYKINEEGGGKKNMNNKVIAVVIDGEVVDIFRFDERTSAILLSNPTFIDISNISIETGWKFDGTKFNASVDGQDITIPAP